MVGVLKRELALSKQANRVCAVLFSVIFIALGAFVRLPLPFTPVPITLQTFFVLLSAGLLGRRLSVITQSSYMLLGALGLPIFTGAASGLGYFISPTAGYLFGFIPAAIIAALYLRRAGDNPRLILQVFCLSSIIILSAGSIWLKVSLRIPLSQALVIGFAPFIIGDFLKATAATWVYLKLKARFRNIL